MDYIAAIEDALNIKAKIELLPLQPGDVPDTYADVDALAEDMEYRPSTNIKQGIEKFVNWYREYYKI